MFIYIRCIILFILDLFRSDENLLIELMVLRQQLMVAARKTKRYRINHSDRFFWVLISRIWPKWDKAVHIVKPATIIKWVKQYQKWRWVKYCFKFKKPGRPWKNKEIRNLIRKMAKENINWGAPRIHGELLKLGLDVSERTVSKYMPRRLPSKKQLQNWLTFLKNQAKGIIAMDMLTVPTLTLKRLYVFFVIHHHRRKILHIAVTYNPSASWICMQLDKVFEKYKIPKYLIHDGDKCYSSHLIKYLRNLGIQTKQISYKSPWQNGIAERWVGSIRRELLDHVIILNQNHLHVLVQEYMDYYNNYRTHYNLGKDPPKSRPITPKPHPNAKLITIKHLNGLHHTYYWDKSA